MAIYARTGRFGRSPRPATQRRVVILQEAVQFPAFLKSLRVICPGAAHPLPVAMVCIAETTSDACSHREGWVQDRRSGGPMLLWRGEHQR
jgi:hypothetical protein